MQRSTVLAVIMVAAAVLVGRDREKPSISHMERVTYEAQTELAKRKAEAYYSIAERLDAKEFKDGTALKDATEKAIEEGIVGADAELLEEAVKFLPTGDIENHEEIAKWYRAGGDGFMRASNNGQH